MPPRPVPRPSDSGFGQVEPADSRVPPGFAAACAAVLEGAGTPRPRRAWPSDLTDREVDVLRLAARGLTNRQIVAELVVSERTVAAFRHYCDTAKHVAATRDVTPVAAGGMAATGVGRAPCP